MGLSHLNNPFSLGFLIFKDLNNASIKRLLFNIFRFFSDGYYPITINMFPRE